MNCKGKYDYKTDARIKPDCPAFHKAKPGDRVSGRFLKIGENWIREVLPEGTGRTLCAYDYYCCATPGVKKIGKGADWSGKTPRWCPWKEERK